MLLTNSRKIFITDQYIRSFDIKDTIYSAAEVKDLCEWVLVEMSLREKMLLLNIYETYENQIINKVKVVFDGKGYNVTKCYYHDKFGWVAVAESGKAYLGKLDLFEADVEIGARSYFSSYAQIRGTAKLSIGQYTSLGNNVSILTSNNSHPTNFTSTYNLGGNLRIVDEGGNLSETFYEKIDFKETCTIGNDVWIGEGVTIMNGVILGDGCVIGTKSLVTKDCEPYGIYGGIPAKLIRYRLPKHIIGQISKIKWWTWSDKKIERNEMLFLTDLSTYTGRLEDIIK